ncbi:MAG: eL32 family ribosomal protein [Candidatus Pacearchaeota archaeon]
MKKIKFLRRNTRDYSRLGRGRKKLQKWRAPKGRDNKMRLKEKGRPRVVALGYGKPNKIKGKIKGKNPVLVKSIGEIKKLKSYEIALIGKTGRKNKIAIAKYIIDNKIETTNFNAEKFLSKIGKEEVKKGFEEGKEKSKEVSK